MPAGACRFLLSLDLRHLTHILHFLFVIVCSTSLRWFLLYDNIALRLQPLFLNKIGLIFQYFLSFLLVNAGPSVCSLLISTVGEVARTSSSTCDLCISREYGAAAANRLSLLPHKLMLLVVAAVALTAAILSMMAFRLHPVLVASCCRIN